MLTGKTAVITGTARGIGKAIALKFAECGANVAILDIVEAADTLESLKQFAPKTQCYVCDVSDFNASKNVIDKIMNDFGSIDILVNNAGITADKLMLAMSEDDFDRVLSVNLKGAFNMTRHVYQIFMKKRAGKIINISSVSGLMGNPGQANYSAAKAGLIGLTKTTAKELASRNVTCNAIAPGFIATGMTENFKDAANAIPLRRMGLAEEVAELALFLASDKADYITGEVIKIDGGLYI